MAVFWSVSQQLLQAYVFNCVCVCCGCWLSIAGLLQVELSASCCCCCCGWGAAYGSTATALCNWQHLSSSVAQATGASCLHSSLCPVGLASYALALATLCPLHLISTRSTADGAQGVVLGCAHCTRLLHRHQIIGNGLIMLLISTWRHILQHWCAVACCVCQVLIGTK